MRVLIALLVLSVAVSLLCDEVLTPEERAAVNKFFRLKFKEAERRLKEGDYITAKHILRALLTLGTDDLRLRKRIESLERICRKEEVRARVVDARIVVKKPIFSGVDSLELFVRLVNRTDKPVVIFHQRERKGMTTNIGWVNIRYIGYGADGTVVEADRAHQRFTKKEQIVLNKNQMWEKVLLLDLPKLAEDDFRVYHYTVSGRIVLEVLAEEEEVYTLTLDMGKLNFKLVPPGAEKFSQEPFKRLAGALKKAASAKFDRTEMEELLKGIFFSPFFVPRKEKGAAVGALVTALPHLPDDLAKAASAALSYLTGRPPTDRAGWIEWWQNVGKK